MRTVSNTFLLINRKKNIIYYAKIHYLGENGKKSAPQNHDKDTNRRHYLTVMWKQLCLRSNFT